jgi:hypothetical protein
MSSRVEGSIMARVAGAAKRANSPYTYGTAGYLALNLLLFAAEAKWHVLSRLTAWDALEIKTLISLLVKHAHH